MAVNYRWTGAGGKTNQTKWLAECGTAVGLAMPPASYLLPELRGTTQCSYIHGPGFVMVSLLSAFCS